MIFVGCFLPSKAVQDASSDSSGKKYLYEEAIEEDFGDISKTTLDEKTGAYNSQNGFFLGGVWTYEALHANDEFAPMSAYYNDAQEGWKHGASKNFYTAYGDAAWNVCGANYCSILGDGSILHPGTTVGAVVTFVAPQSGTISYETSVYSYSLSNNPEMNPETWGSWITLWINDVQVFPSGTNEEWNRLGSHNASADTPFEITLSSLSVKQGDRVRLAVTAHENANASKGLKFVQMPVVTYDDSGETSGSGASNPSGQGGSAGVGQEGQPQYYTEISIQIPFPKIGNPIPENVQAAVTTKPAGTTMTRSYEWLVSEDGAVYHHTAADEVFFAGNYYALRYIGGEANAIAEVETLWFLNGSELSTKTVSMYGGSEVAVELIVEPKGSVSSDDVLENDSQTVRSQASGNATDPSDSEKFMVAVFVFAGIGAVVWYFVFSKKLKGK